MATAVRTSQDDRSSSRASILINVLLLCLCVGVAAIYALPVVAGELIVVPRTHSFGSVQEGDQLRTSFSVRNSHPWPTWIVALNASCGCTSVTSTGHRLPLRLGPWGTAHFATQVDTSGRPGYLEKQIAIDTSDRTSAAILILSATVRPAQ